MAKQTYLELVNRVLRRINQPEITEVVTASGLGLLASNMINEAQNALFNEGVDWHSLYTSRNFPTVTYTASTISFSDSDPDTIDDSASGFGSFSDGMEIVVSNSSGNDGSYIVDTATAGSLTLQSADTLTTEAAGNSITVTARSYPVASDFGRTIDLLDKTNDVLIRELSGRMMDELDPDEDTTSNPQYFSVRGGNYFISPIPNGVVTIKDRYWKVPTALSTNTQTSDLPQECENCLIYWAWSEMARYIQNFEQADRVKLEYNALMKRAKAANDKVTDKLNALGGASRSGRWQLPPPVFPSAYGRFR